MKQVSLHHVFFKEKAMMKLKTAVRVVKTAKRTARKSRRSTSVLGQTFKLASRATFTFGKLMSLVLIGRL